ncbi:MAG: cation-translocating P-type ATPase [Oscillospiraceae bacterium]|nr:cation-translocating P-type ATPase [Oscillospiraceae bacterium]
MNVDFYTLDIEQALEKLGTNIVTGLTTEEVEERLDEYGPNKLSAERRKPFLVKVFGQFRNIFVIILIAAAIFSVFLGEGEGINRFRDAIVIAVILITKISVHVWQESSAEKALRELKNLTSPKATVKRDGQIKSINPSDMVPGDIVLLNVGDYVPADVRLIETMNMRVDEASLGGDSTGTKKDADAVLSQDAPFGDRANLAHMNSIVVYGRGAGIVFATGVDTEAGRVAAALAKPDYSNTALHDKLRSVARPFGILSIVACALVFAVGVLYNFLGFGEHRDLFNLILSSLSLAVATVPMSIVVLATMILAFGMKKMKRANIYVKKFAAIEALGSVSAICSYKTGVITQNVMTVVQMVDPENTYDVTGIGYKAKGIVVADGILSRNIPLMAEIAVLCNDAIFDRRNSEVFGDPTEGALLVLGAKLGQDKALLNAANQRVHEIPFDSSRMMMSTYNMPADRVIMNVKGAPEVIINRSSSVYLDGEIVPMSETIKQRLLAKNEELALKGLRVLAFAYKDYDSIDSIDNVEDGLIYVGMMCLLNPLREKVRESIAKCRHAGVELKMITGDHKLTAAVVAGKLGLIQDMSEIMVGSEISAMSDEELSERVRHTGVFARTSAKDKVRVISALKKDGKFIAVTGDSVRDIHSFKSADIGIAAGKSCADVTREAADIVLEDDNFVGITYALEHGRTIYSNIRKVALYLLGCKLGLILLMLISTLVTLPAPLVAPQILFVCLITSALLAFALSAEKREQSVLTGKPRDSKQSILDKSMYLSIVSRAVFIFAGAMVAYLYGSFIAPAPDGYEHILAMSMCFFTLVVSKVIIAFPSKAEGRVGFGLSVFGNRLLNYFAVFSLGILAVIMYVPAFSGMFYLTPLSIGQVIICIVIALASAGCFELSKRTPE